MLLCTILASDEFFQPNADQLTLSSVCEICDFGDGESIQSAIYAGY